MPALNRVGNSKASHGRLSLRSLSSVWPGLVCFVSLVASGCFSGDYNRRMEETTKQLKQLGDIAAVLFADASPVQDASGTATGITLRLPLVIGDSAKPLQGDDPTAQPPFLQLPGFSYGYEMQIGEQPAYAYFAAVPTAEKPADTLAQEIQAAVNPTFSSAAWRDVPLKTPDGGTVTGTVKLLSVTGPQKFGQDVQDGRFDLYLVSSATHHVLIGWRAPIITGNSANFFKNAELSLGSVKGQM